MRPIAVTRRELIGRSAVIGLSSLGLFVRPSLAQILQSPGGKPTNAWPNASNTGVPASATLTPYNGNLVINTPGAVIGGLDIHGTVTINGSNVTLRGCRVTAANSIGFVVSTWAAMGVTVEDCTIDGVGTGNDGSAGISGSGTFLRNNISHVEHGIYVGTATTLIQDNYIHGLLASGAPHYDGIAMNGGQNNVTVSHNTIINPWAQTSAVMIDNWAGSSSNIVVDNNLLVGGGYTIYDDAHFNGNPISGVSITNNHIGNGHWGGTNFNGTSPIYKGNVDDGAALAQTLSSPW
jgi:hypothetical protein